MVFWLVVVYGPLKVSSDVFVVNDDIDLSAKCVPRSKESPHVHLHHGLTSCWGKSYLKYLSKSKENYFVYVLLLT